MDSSFSSSVKYEFINAERGISSKKIVISNKFHELKDILRGNPLAPFPWLQYFGKKAIESYNDILKGKLMIKTNDVSTSDANVYTERIPFAKRKKHFVDDQFLVEQNYYYTLNPAFSRNEIRSEDILSVIKFTNGYTRVCSESAALGLIWDTLHSLYHTKGSMQEMVDEAIHPSHTAIKNELQTNLALAILHIHTAKLGQHGGEISSDTIAYLEGKVCKLVDLLQADFKPIYTEIEDKLIHRGVWTWKNKAKAMAMVQMSLNFLVTGVWILPRLLVYLQGQNIRFVSAQTISDFILFVNSQRSDEPDIKWFNSMILIMQGLQHNPSSNENLHCLFLNLPYLLSFLTSSFSGRIKNLLGRNGFRMLAGLLTTNQCLHLYHRRNYNILNSVDAHNRDSQLLNYISRGLWVQHNNPINMNALTLQRVSDVGRDLCFNKRGALPSQSACEVITRFGFPYVSTHITELKITLLDFSYILHTRKRSWPKALNELRDYIVLARREMQEAEAVMVSDALNDEILATGRPLQRMTENIIANTYSYVNSFFSNTPSTDNTLKSSDINQEDIIDLFIEIKDLWQYLHMDIFTETNTGRCVVINLKNSTDASRLMQPCLLASIKLAIHHTNIMDSVSELKNPDTIREILSDNAEKICYYFSFPETNQWVRHSDRPEILDDFEGFDQLSQLSRHEMDLLLTKYKDLRLPGLQAGETTFSKIVPALLRIKDSSGHDESRRLEISPSFQYSKQASIAYSIAILNLMMDNTWAQQNTESILSTLEEELIILEQRPSRFLAKAFASNSNAPPILVETALQYIAKKSPLNVESVYNRLQKWFKQWHKNPGIMVFNRFIHNLDRIPEHWGRDATKNLMMACCMYSPYPDMQILSHWIRNQVSDNTGMIKRCYDINPDILTVAILHDISLMTALGVADLTDLSIAEERVRLTMLLARDTLGVSREVMEKTLFFIADFFKVYKKDRIAINMDTSIMINQLNLHANSQDQLVRKGAEGVKIKILEAVRQGRSHSISENVERGLLNAMKKTGDVFEKIFKHSSSSSNMNRYTYWRLRRIMVEWKRWMLGEKDLIPRV